MKFLVAAALLLLPTFAWADGAIVKQSVCTATWDAPQTSADGTPLTDLKEYGVYVASVAVNPTAPIAVVSAPAGDPPAAAIVTWPCKSLVPGQYYVQVDAVDTAGNRSGRSPLVPFVSQDDVPPQAPSGLRVGP